MMDDATILAVFSTREQADKVVDALKDAGFRSEDISIIKKYEEKIEAEGRGGETVERTLTGATAGVAIGGVAGLLIGIGAVAIPGIGALLIGGPIAAALGITGAAATTVSGAITGALAGGLVGALTSIGVPKEHAKLYESEINEGGILIGVNVTEDNIDEAQEIMKDYGAKHLTTVPLNI